MPREDCLRDNNVRNNNKDYMRGFISNFHSQYREVENIFRRHSHVLGINRALNQVLPKHPKFIYRKAPSFGDRDVKSVGSTQETPIALGKSIFFCL